MCSARLALVALLVVPTVTRAADPVDYRKDVKPVLQERCYACHGALAQKGKLRVDSGANMLKAGTIVPGKPGESELVLRVSSDNEATRMPPEGHPLKPEQIEKIKLWVEQGAKVPADDAQEPDPRDHWSFRPVVRPAVPDPKAPNPIDAFVRAKWAEKGLTPVGPADKRVLVRRVYLDLIGLPPTPEQIEAFVKDEAPDAYEKVVDALLASPQYGERWGRHFLDVWRYSDWWGLGAELRNSQRHIWHWRDWTIEAFNADLGYAEMIRQMLAADELYPTDAKKLRATGYLARPYFLFNRTTWLDEVVEHTGKGFLGLTLNCSKCHDHKYDPIKQADYYSFRAIFEPYQLRTDYVGGELDAMKDGIPRAFDANPDAKTPFHVRGDERNVDKDRVVVPGLPRVLAPDGLKVTPVKLPALAYRPGARPEVVAAHKKAAEAKLAGARTALADARAEREKIAKAETPAPNKPKITDGKLILKDDFAKPNPDVWEVGPGMWKHEKGKLLQLKPDGDRSHVRTTSAHPADFEAKFNFVITGGMPYRSVGVSFDVADGNEVLVYVSAGGNKLQAAYKNGASYVYPPDGAVNIPIPVNKPLELHLRVRGSVLNVSYNGEHTLAYTLPVPRKAGKLDLITYTATAEFTGFALRELPKEIELVRPGKGGPKVALTPEVAELNVTAAEKTVAAAEAELASIEARANADASGTKDDARTAAIAEKRVAVANAELALAQADAEVKKAAPAAKSAAVQKRKAAEAALSAAKKAAENPGETYTPIPGALKTRESNLDAAGRTGPFPDTSTGRRTALANWIASKDNPLTARVAVNHVWLRHFGKPLVANVFEFGRKGTAPSHPELLDWLAAELSAHKWSFKHLHKLIVTSQTYRLSSSSANAETSAKIDPENRYLWRMNAVRMEAQTVRDSLLYLAGDLDLAMGGPPVPLAQQDASRRRSLYFFHSHNEHNKLLDIFDNANVLECYRRTESIVPQQALALWNSKLAQTAAAKINDRLHAKLADADDAKFVTAAFEAVLGTSPTKDELVTCLEALAELRGALKDVKEPERSKRARLQVVQALINHNDFVTVR
ncbi:MAG: PSD1 domain-containing protein [Planctomycetes bacterium]|nr:PSD1 domain-containing protein [Planctomycetota bacterium]